MEKFGQVQAYDEHTGIATVIYARPEACEKCGACGKASHSGSIRLKAECKVGDWVCVELPDGRFVQATTLAYGLPLAGFLIGLALGYLLSGHNELIAMAGSLTGVALALGLLWLNEKRIAGRPEWTPRVTRVYEGKPEPEDIGCGGRS